MKVGGTAWLKSDKSLLFLLLLSYKSDLYNVSVPELYRKVTFIKKPFVNDHIMSDVTAA